MVVETDAIDEVRRELLGDAAADAAEALGDPGVSDLDSAE
jgi:hypothetical protein